MRKVCFHHAACFSMRFIPVWFQNMPERRPHLGTSLPSHHPHASCDMLRTSWDDFSMLPPRHIKYIKTYQDIRGLCAMWTYMWNEYHLRMTWCFCCHWLNWQGHAAKQRMYLQRLSQSMMTNDATARDWEHCGSTSLLKLLSNLLKHHIPILPVGCPKKYPVYIYI